MDGPVRGRPRRPRSRFLVVEALEDRVLLSSSPPLGPVVAPVPAADPAAAELVALLSGTGASPAAVADAQAALALVTTRDLPAPAPTGAGDGGSPLAPVGPTAPAGQSSPPDVTAPLGSLPATGTASGTLGDLPTTPAWVLTGDWPEFAGPTPGNDTALLPTYGPVAPAAGASVPVNGASLPALAKLLDGLGSAGTPADRSALDSLPANGPGLDGLTAAGLLAHDPAHGLTTCVAVLAIADAVDPSGLSLLETHALIKLRFDALEPALRAGAGDAWRALARFDLANGDPANAVALFADAAGNRGEIGPSPPNAGADLPASPTPAPTLLGTETVLASSSAEAERASAEHGDSTTGRLSRSVAEPQRALLDGVALPRPDGAPDAVAAREPGRPASSAVTPLQPALGAAFAGLFGALTTGAPAPGSEQLGGGAFLPAGTPPGSVSDKVVVPSAADGSGGSPPAGEGPEAPAPQALDALDVVPFSSKAAALLEGGLPFDLPLKQEVDAFFASLGNLGEAGGGGRAWARCGPWLALLSAAAFELARRWEQKSAGRPASADEAVLGPAGCLPEDEEP